jgi:hypothetical protein
MVSRGLRGRTRCGDCTFSVRDLQRLLLELNSDVEPLLIYFAHTKRYMKSSHKIVHYIP